MKLILMFAVVVLVSCNKAKQPIIEKNTMTKILKEMSEAEVFVYTEIKKDSTKNLDKELYKYYDTIFAINNVEKTDVKADLDFYLQNPNDFKIVLDSAQLSSKSGNYFQSGKMVQ